MAQLNVIGNNNPGSIMVNKQNRRYKDNNVSSSMDINIIQSLNPYEVKSKGILKSNRGEGKSDL